VDASGRLAASYGDPQAVSYLRSTAKPFQALPFIEAGGPERFGLNQAEIALLCASHSGTDEHVAVLKTMQAKTGVREEQLLCGIHESYDSKTAQAMRARGEAPTPNRHDCSGKHTGMLAYTAMQGWNGEDYLAPGHPLQQEILSRFAQAVDLPVEEVRVGIDGCSAPNFAVPLYNAALGYARLAAGEEPSYRVITEAMMGQPVMVAGPGKFDTTLMQAAKGRVVVKSGAEGYLGIGILPGALGAGSPALGLALKIADGDPKGRARPAVGIETLRQMGLLDKGDLKGLKKLGPRTPVRNWRDLVVGEGRPNFVLDRN
jgi:L-asparaginase II